MTAIQFFSESVTPFLRDVSYFCAGQDSEKSGSAHGIIWLQNYNRIGSVCKGPIDSLGKKLRVERFAQFFLYLFLFFFGSPRKLSTLRYLSATLRYFGDFLELPLSCTSTWLGGPPPCSTYKRDRSSRFPARKTRSMTGDKKKILKHRLTCQYSEFISGVPNFETSLSCIEHGVQRFWGFLNFPQKYPKLIT